MLIVVSYDVVNDRRRARPPKILRSSFFDNSDKDHASLNSPFWHTGWNSDANPKFSKELPGISTGRNEASRRKNVVVPRRLEKQAP